MSELKTLKDLQIYKKVGFPSSIDIKEFVSREELREEAIKWVKWLKKSNPDGWHKNEPESAALIFKKFFNITEEDLSPRDDSGEPK